MKRFAKTICTLSLAAGLLVGAAPLGAQTDAPKLPPASTGSLPAGHPDISQLPTTRPSGAGGAAMPDGVTLPAGHPDINQMMEQQARRSTTQPRSSVGKLLIRAVQKTSEAPAAGADDFVAEFHTSKGLLERIEGKLDANGAAEIGLIPLPLEPQPVVRVTHAGAVYEVSAPAMDVNTPFQTVEVPIYETTENAPTWQIKMRHVMVKHIPGGLSVVEMLAVENPADRSWVGREMNKGRRVTFDLDLPLAATQIQLMEGLTESSSRIQGSRLTNFAPIVPGTNHYQIGYTLPATAGSAELTIIAPVAVANVLVFLPDDGTSVSAQGLTSAGTTDMGTGKTRFYKATDVAADTLVKLVVTGITDATRSSSTVSASTTDAAKFFAATGAAITLVLTVAFLFMKPTARKGQK